MSGFGPAKQLIPKEQYFESEWFEREKQSIFNACWTFATTIDRLKNPGDFVTLQFMDHPLVVLKDQQGELKAFHNICRHRGCEVLEGSGNTGKTIVCPYHRWTYQLGGALRGVTNEKECFEKVEREGMGLHQASVGVYADLVFVNPAAKPTTSFEEFIGPMDEHRWPHSFSNGELEYVGSQVYEMKCNWKLFYENAIDGYHLGYLHDKTLGKVYPDKNLWVPVGRNQVWYSTEREGQPQAKTLLSEQWAYGAPTVPGHGKDANYPGVVMLFPLTILSLSPWGLYISVLEPKSPDLTYMRSYAWEPKGTKRKSEHDDKADVIRLVDMDVHPLESGNFQIEDMWIVEKIQRTIRSPHYQVGPLANGAGAEAPITHFQESVLELTGT